MKFRITTASHEIPELSPRFNLSSVPVPDEEKNPVYHNPEGKHWFVEINTLEDLIALAEEVNDRVILYPDPDKKGFLHLTVYDDYME